MKTPRSERHVADYFRGVLPDDEIETMINVSVNQHLELLEEGHDVDWELLFMYKVMALLEAMNREIREVVCQGL